MDELQNRMTVNQAYLMVEVAECGPNTPYARDVRLTIGRLQHRIDQLNLGNSLGIEKVEATI